MTLEEQFDEITKIYNSMPTKERNYFNPNDEWTDTPHHAIFYRKVIPQKGFVEVCFSKNREKTKVNIDYAVAPEYRRQGIAKSLLSEAIHYCKTHGTEAIYADVHFQNKKSKMLLKKYSFHEFGRIGKMLMYKMELG